MPRRFPIILLTLTLLAVAPLHAAPRPVPPLVQKFVETVTQARTLSVDAVQVVPTGSIGENAHLIFSRPNKLKLTARLGTQLIVEVVSDGGRRYQWNQEQFVKDTALSPQDDPSGEMSLTPTADLMRLAFLSPQWTASSPGVQDKGAVVLRGVAARRFVQMRGSNALTLWLAAGTGLPMQMQLDNSSQTLTVVFKNIQLNKSVAATVFSARPPKTLTAYAPPSAPAEAPLLAVGSPAPDFTLPSPGGSPVTLSSLKGQVVLIDFWATWCGPCMEAMPHIQALHKEFGGKGLKVLSINTSDTLPAMTKFRKTHKEYTTTMLFDGASPSVSSAKYKVTGIPTVYLIDKNGSVAASFVGYNPDGEAQIKAALAKLGVE